LNVVFYLECTKLALIFAEICKWFLNRYASLL
jgi:hypothetical protein